MPTLAKRWCIDSIGPFASKLSATLFTFNGLDEQLVRRELLDKGMSHEEIQKLPLAFWKKMCRRIIDAPDVVAPKIDSIVKVRINLGLCSMHVF